MWHCHIVEVEEQGDNVKLMNAMIQNAAGRTMLDESQVPKPLIAASVVISSMVVEKLADILILLQIGASATDDATIAKMGHLSNKEESELA